VSAARRGGFDRIVFHHDPDLDSGAIQFLSERIPNLELRQIPSPPESWTGLGPTARANLMRLRILREEGGVHLDMDTITLASFRPLLDTGFFCGTEAVVFSASLRGSRNPVKWACAIGKTCLRRICRWTPGGWRAFRKFERFFEHQPNNAVMGSVAHHPALTELASLAERRADLPGIRPKDIGVRLLQEFLATPAMSTRSDIELLDHRSFYPLPPDIAAHWFRTTSRLALQEMTSPQTRCVHWYASLVPRSSYATIDKSWIEANRDRIPLAGLIDRLDLPL